MPGTVSGTVSAASSRFPSVFVTIQGLYLLHSLSMAFISSKKKLAEQGYCL
jgi:hypothetical protein